MRLQNFRNLLVSVSVALTLSSCDMFRNDPQPNANDPYSQYGAGGAYGAQTPGAYGAQTNPYGTTPPAANPYGGYTAPPPASTYTPPPYTQPADPYSSGSHSSGNTGSGSSAGGRSHTVARGDTLSGIGRRYSVGVSELMRANNLNSDLIREGQKLTIP